MRGPCIISVNACCILPLVQRQGDEEPLYIFDHDFVAAAPELAAEYTVPHVFDQDLLQLLGGCRGGRGWCWQGGVRIGEVLAGGGWKGG